MEVRVRRLGGHRGGDRKDPNVPMDSMSADGALWSMARTALRSPSATAVKRGDAIIFCGGRCGEEASKDQDANGRRKAETGAEVETTWRWCNKG